MYLTGLVHYTERASESEFEFNYRLSGTDVTGESYRFNATIIGNFAGPPDGETLVTTFVSNVRLIGLAGAESSTAQFIVQVTEVDGTVRASVERIVPLC